MGSKSSSSKSSEYNTFDKRAAVDGEGNVTNTGDNVTLNMVPDEAFELAEFALAENTATNAAALEAVRVSGRDAVEEIGTAMFRVLEAEREESAKMGEQMIRLGIPAAAMAFVAYQVWGK